MALQKQFTTREEFEAPEAYINCKRCKYESGMITAVFIVFKDSTKEIQIGDYGVSLEADMNSSDNFVIQAYNEFKSHPEMEGAIDILE